jgi:hypothetical protein
MTRKNRFIHIETKHFAFHWNLCRYNINLDRNFKVFRLRIGKWKYQKTELI